MSRLKLMSIGRVCTCGHTRAPRANCSATRASTRGTLSRRRGRVEERRERGRDAVRERQLGELVDARERDVGVVELRHHLEHAAELAEHRRERVELLGCAKRLGTGNRFSSTST